MYRMMWTVVFCLALTAASCTAPDDENVPQPAEQTMETDPDYDPEARLAELGIVLPDPGAPVANYVNAVRSGNLLFLAGKGPNLPEGGYVTGKLGRDLSVEEGYEAARLTAIQHIAVLNAELNDLRSVRRIVKVTGMVNAMPDFTDNSAVINGYSDLMAAVFGERGKHARAAVGMASLPLGIAVEVEAIVEISAEPPNGGVPGR